MSTKAGFDCATLGIVCFMAGSPAKAADVSFERLLHPETANWLTNNADYSSHRFSTLTTINASNIGNLRPVFTVGVGGASAKENLVATPLVDDGF